MPERRVEVNDAMQKGYVYLLSEGEGENFRSDFAPELTPKEMLSMGVFGGKYMNDCRKEFPELWFKGAQLSPGKRDPFLNYFEVDASQSLAQWRAKGWINPEDPRGWFQWYCRYYMGRRFYDDDRQIKRWRAMKRHIGQVRKNCAPKDLGCRRRQRQALLNWAYDSRNL